MENPTDEWGRLTPPTYIESCDCQLCRATRDSRVERISTMIEPERRVYLNLYEVAILLDVSVAAQDTKTGQVVAQIQTEILLPITVIPALNPASARDAAVRLLTDEQAAKLTGEFPSRVLVREFAGNVPARW